MIYRLETKHVNSILLNITKPLALSDWFERVESDSFVLSFYTYVESQVNNFMFTDGWYKREYSDFVNTSKYILNLISVDKVKELNNVKMFRDSLISVFNYYIQDVGVFILKQVAVMHQRSLNSTRSNLGLSNLITALPTVLTDSLGVYFIDDLKLVDSKKGVAIISSNVLTSNRVDILNYLNDDFVSQVIGARDDFSTKAIKSACDDARFSNLALKGLLYVYLSGKESMTVIDEKKGGVS